MDGSADFDEQVEPLSGGEIFLVAVFSDGDAPDEFHHEVGMTGLGGAGVEDFGDIGVVHQGQCLALGLKAGDDLFSVHPGLDDLQRDLTLHWFCLFRNINNSHSSFADLFHQLVGSNQTTDCFGARRHVDVGGDGWIIEKLTVLIMNVQECFNTVYECSVIFAGLLNISCALCWRLDFTSFGENGFFVVLCFDHVRPLMSHHKLPIYLCVIQRRIT
jgi:hypothetical protein